MNKFIICIGNRFVFEDRAGPLVFDRLQEKHSKPDEVKIIEGGIAGLNLLEYLEQGGRIVFVDSTQGIAAPGEIKILEWHEILETSGESHFGHDSGLTYLLTVLPKVCEGKLPEEIVFIGLEGTCTSQMIDKAADWSFAIAIKGLQEFKDGK